MQLNRHRKKCDKPERPEAKKYVFKDGKFACCSCNRSFKHLSNANRHFKSCKSKENGKVMFQCPRCPKTLNFKVILHVIFTTILNSRLKHAQIVNKCLKERIILKVT